MAAAAAAAAPKEESAFPPPSPITLSGPLEISLLRRGNFSSIIGKW